MTAINWGPFAPASTYPDILNLNSGGLGLTNIPEIVCDGYGNPTSMSMSNLAINFNRGVAQFQLDGVALTATAAALNAVGDFSLGAFVLSAPDGNLPNSSIIAAGSGLTLTAAGGYQTISASGELLGLSALNANGIVVRTGLGTYQSDVFTSSGGSIDITNPDGVAGNPDFNVVDNTSVQMVNVELNAALTSTRDTLNFIPGLNMGIVVVDNAGQGRTDITFSAASENFAFKAPVYAATTGANLNAVYDNGVAGVGATLTNNGALAAFTLDGTSPALNARILVKDQADQTQNGIYVLSTVGDGATAWVLTRSTDFDTPGLIPPGSYTLVTAGTVNINTSWIETAVVNTIGTDPIVFQQFGFVGSVTSVNGTAGQIDVTNPTTTPVISIDPAYVGQTSITTLGTITTGHWHGSVIPLAYGGTNADLTASNGGIFYSTATAGAILAGTATADQILMSGANSAPAWSTTTYPSATNEYDMLYAISANEIATLSTIDNSVLTTGSTGLPAWLGPLTNGQLIIGDTGNRPAAVTLTAGLGITITNGPGSITISQAPDSTFQLEVNQIAHGLVVGNIIRISNTGFVVAQADSVADSTSLVGIVVEYIDANNFVFQYGGIVSVLTGLTTADPYFLDPAVAGNYTPTIPTTPGQVVYPLFIALSDTTILWQPKLAIELM